MLSGSSDSWQDFSFLVSTPSRLTQIYKKTTEKKEGSSDPKEEEEKEPADQTKDQEKGRPEDMMTVEYLILDDFERLTEMGAILDIRALIAQLGDKKRTTIISTSVTNSVILKVL